MQNQQLPARIQKRPSKVAKRIFGWIAVVSYALAVVSQNPSNMSAMLAFTAVAFLSAVLWLIAYKRYQRAMPTLSPAPPSPNLPSSSPNKATAENIYLETSRLRQEAQYAASQAALYTIGQTPDEMNGLMILGAAIDPEQYEQESPLLKRVIKRERVFWVLTGRKL